MKAIFFIFTLFFSACTFAESGTFKMSGLGLANVDMISHGNSTFLIADVANAQTIYKSSGTLFKDGDIISVEAIAMLKKQKNQSVLEGYGSGILNGYPQDKIFMSFLREEGDLSSGGGGFGKITFAGGTGKFTNLKGSCKYKVDYLDTKGTQMIDTTCKYMK